MRAVFGVAVALLGAACIQGRQPPQGRDATRPPERCTRIPGRGVEGFSLHRTREIEYASHVALRTEYRDRGGRRLFYLRGVLGELGEGTGESEPVTLVDGTPATFFGQRDAWGVYWEDDPPCPQMAVIGNVFRRHDFIELMEEARVLNRQSAFRLLPFGLPEWVAVFRTASSVDSLQADTDALLEVAPANLVVAPVGCHQGLAGALGVDEGSYFSGVVAQTRPELRTVLESARQSPRFREEPLLVGEFTLLCGF
jgi:hypothetical protein